MNTKNCVICMGKRGNWEYGYQREDNETVWVDCTACNGEGRVECAEAEVIPICEQCGHQMSLSDGEYVCTSCYCVDNYIVPAKSAGSGLRWAELAISRLHGVGIKYCLARELCFDVLKARRSIITDDDYEAVVEQLNNVLFAKHGLALYTASCSETYRDFVFSVARNGTQSQYSAWVK